jgi:nitroimidazol reductase NimA-like FMN-containing flavoprotein (pyridoxamine 5'-phosphate oxidase superfamily)
MSDVDEREAFERIVQTNQYMTLATADASGQPWASPVWFATADCEEFVWVSSPEARHSRNLAARAELAIAIFDSRQAPGTGQGVYLSAMAAPVPEDDLDHALSVFSEASQRAGAGSWNRQDVRPPARLRLYRATAVDRFVLSSRDERVPVPPGAQTR